VRTGSSDTPRPIPFHSRVSAPSPRRPPSATAQTAHARSASRAQRGTGRRTHRRRGGGRPTPNDLRAQARRRRMREAACSAMAASASSTSRMRCVSASVLSDQVLSIRASRSPATLSRSGSCAAPHLHARALACLCRRAIRQLSSPARLGPLFLFSFGVSDWDRLPIEGPVFASSLHFLLPRFLHSTPLLRQLIAPSSCRLRLTSRTTSPKRLQARTCMPLWLEPAWVMLECASLSGLSGDG